MKSRAYVIGQILAAASFILAAGGCTDKAEEDIYPYADANEPIVIRASSEALGVATRAEGEEVTPEWITDGKYLFTYPLSADGKEMASLVCEFKEGYGYIYKENGDLLKKGELQYDGGSKVYLDNLVNYKVDGPVGQGTDNFTCIEFGISAESGFTPSLMYARADDRIVDIGDKKVDVDILWDSTVPTRDARSIDFKLKHKMSRVTFRFHSEKEEIKSLLKNRENIKVTLNNIKTTLYDDRDNPNPRIAGFNRSTGLATNLGKAPTETVFLLGEEGGKLDHDQSNDRFAAPDYIFPPFTYGNHKTAGITIDLGENEIYKGKFPGMMMYQIIIEKEPQLVGATMAFLAGYHLTIDVELANSYGSREVLFTGVYVQDFTKDPSESLKPQESGIYSWEDYDTLVELYEELASSGMEDFRLYKYGTFKNGQWTFHLWKDLETDKSLKEIAKFKDDNFIFEFNNHKITVYNEGKYTEIRDQISLVQSTTSKTE